MVHLALYIMAFLMAPIELIAQCATGNAQLYGTTSAFQSGTNVITSNIAYFVGGDAADLSITANQLDAYVSSAGRTPLTPILTTTVAPGVTATITRVTPILQYGFGEYNNQEYVTAVNTCTGQTFPPYSSGSAYSTQTSVYISQPQLTANSSIYTKQFVEQTSPQIGSIEQASTSLDVSYNSQLSGTPVLTLEGATTSVVASAYHAGETITNTDNGFYQISASPNATGGCFVAVTGYYVIDGLKSNTVNLTILSLLAIDATSPTTNQHVDNLPTTSGYLSNWYYQTVDSCGAPVPNTYGGETFPSGTVQVYPNTTAPTSNWAGPTANTWVAGATGGWLDTIGFIGDGTENPLATNPQSPLNPTAVTETPQIVYIGPYVAYQTTQVHFVDHGGYLGSNP
jgi:hypothetical protein